MTFSSAMVERTESAGLKKQVRPAHGVVFIDNALMRDGKDPIQIRTPHRDERHSCLCSRPGSNLRLNSPYSFAAENRSPLPWSSSGAIVILVADDLAMF